MQKYKGSSVNSRSVNKICLLIAQTRQKITYERILSQHSQRSAKTTEKAEVTCEQLPNKIPFLINYAL
ncbi:hypothetical protein VNO77_24523 [Canavalia gladiata]|uniref:Uncharacterized protein n=1 Tax=Canavalia gladiata TaxID=3824 RepID=A0AAN9QGC1_CANGL